MCEWRGPIRCRLQPRAGPWSWGPSVGGPGRGSLRDRRRGVFLLPVVAPTRGEEQYYSLPSEGGSLVNYSSMPPSQTCYKQSVTSSPTRHQHHHTTNTQSPTRHQHHSTNTPSPTRSSLLPPPSSSQQKNTKHSSPSPSVSRRSSRLPLSALAKVYAALKSPISSSNVHSSLPPSASNGFSTSTTRSKFPLWRTPTPTRRAPTPTPTRRASTPTRSHSSASSYVGGRRSSSASRLEWSTTGGKSEWGAQTRSEYGSKSVWGHSKSEWGHSRSDWGHLKSDWGHSKSEWVHSKSERGHSRSDWCEISGPASRDWEAQLLSGRSPSYDGGQYGSPSWGEVTPGSLLHKLYAYKSRASLTVSIQHL